MDHVTAEFAVETIRRWWRWMGQKQYPQAKRLPITAAHVAAPRVLRVVTWITTLIGRQQVA
jgi:hypothetical protein